MSRLLASVCALCLIVWAGEAWQIYGIYSDAWRQSAANEARASALSKKEKEVRDLENGRATVQVVHARLIDSTVPPDLSPSLPAAIPGARREAASTAPPFRQLPPLELLSRDGIAWRFGSREVPAGDRSRAVRAETVTEYHRLMPVLAALENSYPLVTTDDLAISLPASATPFSKLATPAQVEASFRVPLRLSAPAKPR